MPSLQIKVDNLEKREEYLEAWIEINDMPSSGAWSDAISHQSLDEHITGAVDEMMEK